jgi:hypothetical protein
MENVFESLKFWKDTAKTILVLDVDRSMSVKRVCKVLEAIICRK